MSKFPTYKVIKIMKIHVSSMLKKIYSYIVKNLCPCIKDNNAGVIFPLSKLVGFAN